MGLIAIDSGMPNPRYTKMRQLDVGDVGKGHNSTAVTVAHDIGTTTVNGISQIGPYTAPMLPDSDVPGLLGA